MLNIAIKLLLFLPHRFINLLPYFRFGTLSVIKQVRHSFDFLPLVTRYFKLQKLTCNETPPGGVLGSGNSGFAGYVPLASQNPHPIIVYSVASYRPHLSHFWANVIVISRTEFNASRLLNIKTTSGLQEPIFNRESSHF